MRRIVLALLLLIGVASAAQIDPQGDVLMKNTDGEYVEIFSVEAWQSDLVSFAGAVSLQNGTAVIGCR